MSRSYRKHTFVQDPGHKKSGAENGNRRSVKWLQIFYFYYL